MTDDCTRSVLDAMTGRRLPGGCDDCNAYQTVTTQGGGLYVLTVHHDETCPWLHDHDDERTAS